MGREFSTKGLGLKMALLDTLIAVALASYQWDPGAIRALAQDGLQGYRMTDDPEDSAPTVVPVPPITVIGWIDGQLENKDGAPTYGRGGRCSRVWRINHESVYNPLSDVLRDGMHRTLPLDRNHNWQFRLSQDVFPRRGKRPRAFPWSYVLEELDEDWLPKAFGDTAPLEQAIGFEIPDRILAAQGTVHGHATTWESQQPEALGLAAFLEVPEATPKRLPFRLQEAPRDSTKGARRYVLRLAHEDHDPTPRLEAPELFRTEEVLALQRLLTRYEIVIQDATSGRELLRHKVDFRHPKANRVCDRSRGQPLVGRGRGERALASARR